MDLAVANSGDVRATKKGRHEMLISGEFPPLESIDFMNPSNSFYNTIELPSEMPFWPDLTAQYTPYEEKDAAPGMVAMELQQEDRDTDDSKECATPMVSPMEVDTVGSAAHMPYVVTDDSELAAADESARFHLQKLTDNEARWRETLARLTNDYNPGTVLGEVQQMEERVRGDLSDIDELLERSILHVEDLFSVLSLKNRYENVLHHAEILEQEELFHLEDDSGSSPEDLVTLEWTDQPLAKSFKNKNRARATNKKKKGHCVMTASLVCAPGVSFHPTSAVTARFYQVEDDDVVIKRRPARAPSGRSSRKRAMPTLMDSVRGEELSDVQIQNNVEKFSKNQQVTFDFRFPAGTRNKPCNIRLHVKGTVTLPNGSKSPTVEIVSQPTHNFIITTNECQFETAELKLLMMEIFTGGRQKCSWSRFVNALNVRWMRATRQEADSGVQVTAERELMADDYRFIARFFRNAPHEVTRDEVVAFYSFFGKATHHYRHNLAFRQLMMEGLVWGFISKDESARLLETQATGAFVIRVSESTPGSFCLSWKTDSFAVRHAIMDVKLFSPPALAEFLMKKPFLKAVLQPFTVHNKARLMQKTLRKKEEAFGAYLADAAATSVVKKEGDSGYCDLNLL